MFRFITERKFNHEVWFLYYPEEGNKRGAPVQLLRGVEFGLETKALLYKRLCAYAGLHCEVRLGIFITNDVVRSLIAYPRSSNQVVKGYSKSTEYLPGEEFADTTYRNSWNAVYAAGGWRLVQCNWGMMSVNNKVMVEAKTLSKAFVRSPMRILSLII